MITSSHTIIKDKDFASPYCKNYSSDYVLSLQPVEKAMFAFKLLPELDSNLRDSSQEYAASAQHLFEWLNIPCIVVSGSLKARPEEKHFWDIVTIDGYSFHFDAYFANPKQWEKFNQTEDMKPIVFGNPACQFFCVSTSRISQTHVFGENFPQVDCPHSLSQELVRDLASMSVSVQKDPCRILRSGMTSGMLETKPVSPLRIDYTPATTPITLSFE